MRLEYNFDTVYDPENYFLDFTQIKLHKFFFLDAVFVVMRRSVGRRETIKSTETQQGSTPIVADYQLIHTAVATPLLYPSKNVI